MAAKILPLLKALIQQDGSDLHLASASAPMLRIRGHLAKLDVPALSTEEVENHLSEILTKTQKQHLLKNKNIDFSVKVSTLGVFRVNIFYQRHGISAVFRALPVEAPSINELGLPPVCTRACNYPNGLVLVTGPTGSGKSTTLAAMINYINERHRKHIITLEDPIEFHHDTKLCMVNQRQLGVHFNNFKDALRSSLREDPDVILVGEMRDVETIQMAITAAETGHLVFATLHTNSASKSVDRILDSFNGNEQNQIRAMLSESLRLVVSQKLIPTKNQSKRIAVHDILVNNAAIANLIREGKTHQISSVMQTARQEGMQQFDQVLLNLVQQNQVSGPDAWNFANNKAHFSQWAPRENVESISVRQNKGSLENKQSTDKILKKTGSE